MNTLNFVKPLVRYLYLLHCVVTPNPNTPPPPTPSSKGLRLVSGMISRILICIGFEGKFEVIALLSISLSLYIPLISSYLIFLLLTYVCKPDANYYGFNVLQILMLSYNRLHRTHTHNTS